jgi:hypothetical protein
MTDCSRDPGVNLDDTNGPSSSRRAEAHKRSLVLLLGVACCCLLLVHSHYSIAVVGYYITVDTDCQAERV